ncbi:MAG: hypothetical protein ABIQ18_37640 [Umezawaea sp.]
MRTVWSVRPAPAEQLDQGMSEPTTGLAAQLATQCRPRSGTAAASGTPRPTTTKADRIAAVT